MIPINPEAIGDPNQTPVVYLGEENGRALNIPQRSMPEPPRPTHTTDERMLQRLDAWVADQEERYGWNDEDQPTYAYRLMILRRCAEWGRAAQHLTEDENRP